MNVAVIGGHKCSKRVYKIAQLTGSLIGDRGWVLVCGGGPGVMEAACKGAKSAGGLTVGILPSYDGAEANKFLDVRLPTGFGYARNILVARAADAIIAIDGEYGTLSEIAFALNPPKKLVVGLGTWDIKGVVKAASPKEAINCVEKHFNKRNNKK
ncbi:MAG: TIGR00725 family protein [Candidatus Omnitrophica bacterium]|nr:TIGR00725 family protein [Candidatus Omnitrophota bacterium]MDD5429446.1 TIGR00725 family protein [Candidatus Omnitrophota bacterium]